MDLDHVRNRILHASRHLGVDNRVEVADVTADVLLELLGVVGELDDAQARLAQRVADLPRETLRDEFAKAALAAVLSDPWYRHGTHQDRPYDEIGASIAADCYRIADAMLAAREHRS